MVRQYVKENAGEDQWVFLQSIVYGQRINDAKPYPGVVEFISQATKQLDIYIISHKTKIAQLDKKTDLIKAATYWLNKHNITQMLPNQAIHFENSRDNKISRIKMVRCDVFIDDLIDVFLHPGFPHKTQKILFDPTNFYKVKSGISVVNCWEQLNYLIPNQIKNELEW